MLTREFRINRVSIVVLALDLLLLVALFACTIVFESGLLQTLMSGFFTLVLAYTLWEMSQRRLIVAHKGLTIRKFFKKRTIPWEDITDFDILLLRKRAYFIINAEKNGFNFFSNAYNDVYECAGMIKERVTEEKVSAALKNSLETPVKNYGDIVAALIAGTVIALILYFKYYI